MKMIGSLSFKGLLVLSFLSAVTGQAEAISPDAVNKTICGETKLPDGRVVKNCMQAIWNPPRAEITATPASHHVAIGQNATLSWVSQGASECTFTYSGQSLTGTSHVPVDVQIDRTTTFDLSCSGPGGVTTDQVTITAGASPILNIHLGTNSIAAGESTSLSWNTQNVTSCVVTRSDGGTCGTPNQCGNTSAAISTGNIPNSSTTTALTLTYTLTCQSPSGVASSQATLTIAPAGTYCADVPAGGIADVPHAPPLGALARSTYFHGNVAVDPGNTNKDCAGAKSYPVRTLPSSTLENTSFSLPLATLRYMIQISGVQALEWVATGHEYCSGTDRVIVTFNGGGQTLSVDSGGSIYSSYGYVTFRNLRLENGIPYGDVAARAFPYSASLGIPAQYWQDATNLINPADQAMAPTHTLNHVDLSNFRIDVRIFANSYDSVQYRSIRANIWSSPPIPPLPPCP